MSSDCSMKNANRFISRWICIPHFPRKLQHFHLADLWCKSLSSRPPLPTNIYSTDHYHRLLLHKTRQHPYPITFHSNSRHLVLLHQRLESQSSGLLGLSGPLRNSWSRWRLPPIRCRESCNPYVSDGLDTLFCCGGIFLLWHQSRSSGTSCSRWIWCRLKEIWKLCGYWRISGGWFFGWVPWNWGAEWRRASIGFCQLQGGRQSLRIAHLAVDDLFSVLGFHRCGQRKGFIPMMSFNLIRSSRSRRYNCRKLRFRLEINCVNETFTI